MEVKVEDYDGTYDCLICGRSVRGQLALHCTVLDQPQTLQMLWWMNCAKRSECTSGSTPRCAKTSIWYTKIA